MRSGARADQSLSRRPRSSRATPRQRAAAARSRIRCAVDARALREYVQGTGHAADAVPRHKDGTSYGATRRELARRLLTRVCVDERDSDGMGHVVPEGGCIVLYAV